MRHRRTLKVMAPQMETIQHQVKMKKVSVAALERPPTWVGDGVVCSTVGLGVGTWLDGLGVGPKVGMLDRLGNGVGSGDG